MAFRTPEEVGAIDPRDAAKDRLDRLRQEIEQRFNEPAEHGMYEVKLSAKEHLTEGFDTIIAELVAAHWRADVHPGSQPGDVWLSITPDSQPAFPGSIPSPAQADAAALAAAEPEIIGLRDAVTQAIRKQTTQPRVYVTLPQPCGEIAIRTIKQELAPDWHVESNPSPMYCQSGWIITRK